MKIGIVGFGYVGQAIHASLKEHVEVSIYDIGFRDLRNIRALKDAAFIFIALPTPNDGKGRQDPEALESFFQCFEKAFPCRGEWDPVFVLKSTTLYENIEPFLQNYRLVVNPEFLSQNTAFEDCVGQKNVILGGRRDLTCEVERFFRDHTLINCSFEHMSAREAINFKYIRNIYGAYKVLFWNWVQEQTGNARKYAALYEKIPQGEMSQIASDGKLGFGGACFPKDVEAFDAQNPHVLTRFIQEYNRELREDFREFREEASEALEEPQHSKILPLPNGGRSL